VIPGGSPFKDSVYDHTTFAWKHDISTEYFPEEENQSGAFV
jgi:hypothetical protein